jgi:hypothetical protein
MESTAFFEKKISLTPAEFNEVKNSSIDSLLEKKARDIVENKCSEQGFVLPGTIKLLSRSMGFFESARFTGDAVYYVKLEGKIVYPADGIRAVGEVIRKNKMGLYVDYRKAIRIQIPRDLHIGSEEYENVEVGDLVEVEIKRSKFQIKDPYILASGIFIAKKTETSVPIGLKEEVNDIKDEVKVGGSEDDDNEEDVDENEDNGTDDEEEEEYNNDDENDDDDDDNEGEDEEEDEED